jgi:hypothetical protein
MIVLWFYLAVGLGVAGACLLIYVRLSPAERAHVDDGLDDLGFTMPSLMAGAALLWPVVLADLARRRR